MHRLQIVVQDVCRRPRTDNASSAPRKFFISPAQSLVALQPDDQHKKISSLRHQGAHKTRQTRLARHPDRAELLLPRGNDRSLRKH